jgi:DNA repair protein RecN (Recombination protein N)
LPEVLHLLDGREPFVDVVARLRAVMAELDDVTGDLRGRSELIEEDPERLAVIRGRRQTLTDLRRKYGDDLTEVMAFHAAAADRLRELVEYDRRAADLDGLLAAAITAERAEAIVVGEARRRAAPVLAAAVQARLRELAMPDARIAVEVGTSGDDHPGDDVRFLLSANPGSPMLPLNRVASGGELARAMLALRLVLSEAGSSSGASTIVFDEVDAGVGGSAAVAVGAALAGLGRHHQVLIVTHLAQVAAAASSQIVVSKSVDGERTATTIRALTGDDRAVEVARMLSGDVSAAALEHARTLLDH